MAIMSSDKRPISCLRCAWYNLITNTYIALKPHTPTANDYSMTKQTQWSVGSTVFARWCQCAPPSTTPQSASAPYWFCPLLSHFEYINHQTCPGHAPFQIQISKLLFMPGIWGLIHRHCPNIYPQTCHKIILWQMLRYHKMILQNILRQFTKFVLGDLKYFPDVTCYHSHCDIRTHFAYGCVYDMGTGTHFIHQLQCLAAPVPPFDQAHTLPQHGH